MNHIIPITQNIDPTVIGSAAVSINADVNGYDWTITSSTGSDIGFGDGNYGENDQ